MSGVPGFPLGVGTPAPEKLADRLARALPDADRDAGRRLGERLFAGKDSRRAAQSAYAEAAEALDPRLPESDSRGFRRWSPSPGSAPRPGTRSASASRATSPTIRPSRSGQPWVTDEVSDWRDRGAEAIAAEAGRRLAELEDWRRGAEDTSVWETRRVDYNHARWTLQSARTGVFGSAAGPFADFLRQVGEPIDELDVH